MQVYSVAHTSHPLLVHAFTHALLTFLNPEAQYLQDESFSQTMQLGMSARHAAIHVSLLVGSGAKLVMHLSQVETVLHDKQFAILQIS